MRVSENDFNEIFEERAQYLVDTDEMFFEMYEETIPDQRFISLHDTAIFAGNIDIIDKIKVADKLFESKEYKTFIQLTSPKETLDRKFQTVSSIKKLRSIELEDFSVIDEE